MGKMFLAAGLIYLSSKVLAQCPTSGTILSDCTTAGNLTVTGGTLTVNPGVTMTVIGTLTLKGGGTIIATNANVTLVNFSDGFSNNTLTGGNYTVSGTFNTGGGGDFNMSGVTLNATGSSSFSGSDIVIDNSTLTLASMTSNLSTMTISSSTITTTGTGGLELEDATVTSSTLIVGGTLNIDSGTSTVSDSDLDVGVGFVNDTGQNAITMNGGGKLYLNSNTTMDVKGDVQNNEMYINASNVNVTGDFDNFGAETLEVSNAGSILINGNYDNGGSGSTTAQGGGTIEVVLNYDNSNGNTNVDGGGMTVGGTYSGDDPVVTGGADEECIGGAGGCCGSACSILPVTLISFAIQAELDVVKLVWVTASELNNDHFNVYRSSNGVNFDLIDWVAGNGTTDEQKSYTFEDVPTKNGIYYYQLEQVDFDGKNEFFPIVRVNFNLSNASTTSIYPMPLASDQTFYMDFSEDQSLVGAKIVNISGSLRYDLPYEIEPDRIRFNSTALGLPSGFYLVQIMIGHEVYVHKVHFL